MLMLDRKEADGLALIEATIELSENILQSIEQRIGNCAHKPTRNAIRAFKEVIERACTDYLIGERLRVDRLIDGRLPAETLMPCRSQSGQHRWTRHHGVVHCEFCEFVPAQDKGSCDG